ncbi:MAG: hypothetical protein CM1200mP6_07590 [Anaerolineaceae bacterium]|nr:MAG: hypothetical protein CM1200mP6_07590 [Anaerolineaceae bacterium]
MCLVAPRHNGNAKSHQVLGRGVGLHDVHDGVWQATADEIADTIWIITTNNGQLC